MVLWQNDIQTAVSDGEARVAFLLINFTVLTELPRNLKTSQWVSSRLGLLTSAQFSKCSNPPEITHMLQIPNIDAFETTYVSLK